MNDLCAYRSGVPLYFAHIPKSGGTTLSMLLERLYPLSEIFQPKLLWDVGEIDVSSQSEFQLFRGHFNALGHIISYRNTQNITLLRDPVNMAISSYNHVKRDPETRWHERVNNENWTLEDFITNPNTQNLTTNRMTNFLHLGAKSPTLEGELNLNVDSFRKLKRSVKLSQRSQGVTSKTELAQGYLKNCLWVGVLEQLDRSLQMLCYTMALPPIQTQPRLNKSDQNTSLSKKTRQLLMERNQSDCLLYQQALTRLNVFEQTVSAQCGQKLTPELIDQNYQNNYLNLHNKVKVPEVNLKMTDGIIGDQWHQREWCNERQDWFRWSGPRSKSFLDFWLVPKDYQLTVELVTFPQSDHLSLLANGNELKYVMSRNNVNWVIKAQVRRGMIRANGLLRLEFDVQNTNSIKSGNDEIAVGLGLEKISIF